MSLYFNLWGLGEQLDGLRVLAKNTETDPEEDTITDDFVHGRGDLKDTLFKAVFYSMASLATTCVICELLFSYMKVRSPLARAPRPSRSRFRARTPSPHHALRPIRRVHPAEVLQKGTEMVRARGSRPVDMQGDPKFYNVSSPVMCIFTGPAPAQHDELGARRRHALPVERAAADARRAQDAADRRACSPQDGGPEEPTSMAN